MTFFLRFCLHTIEVIIEVMGAFARSASGIKTDKIDKRGVEDPQFVKSFHDNLIC